MEDLRILKPRFILFCFILEMFLFFLRGITGHFLRQMFIILFQLERNVSAIFDTELLKGFFIIFLNCKNIIGLIEFCLFP